MHNSSLTLIIPIYNEAQSLTEFLPQVIQFCQQHHYRVILVNDGSTDKTKEILNQYRFYDFVTIIHMKLNCGYGAAIKKGIRSVETEYLITLDADGQHRLEDIVILFQAALSAEADMVVGGRVQQSNYYRSFGKWIIRTIASLLMPLSIRDINSGMKLYNSDLAKKYINLCPNTMAFSDIILLAFVSHRNRVIEVPISTNPRAHGKSTINTMTAIDTFKEILNIVVLFNPMRFFFPLGIFSILISLGWALPFVINGRGLSVGALLGVMTGIIILFLGILAEQISALRKSHLE